MSLRGHEIGSDEPTGRGPLDRRAKTALALTLTFLVLAVVLGVAALRSGEGEEARAVPRAIPDDTTAPDQVEVGDCFDDQAAQGIVGFPTVPCARPHDNEIYHLFDVPSAAADPFPGDERMGTVVQEGCLDAFEGYVGVPFERSVLRIFPISPSREAWEGGDREVVCALYQDGTRLTGSVRGSRR
jgi:hypothetical protein